MSAPIRTDRVRFMAIIFPKEGMSFEDFSAHWRGPHQELFMALDIVKKNITKYEQIHINLPLHTALAQQSGAEVPSFYGVAVFEAESFEKVMEVFQHEEFIKAIRGDEGNFMQSGKTQIIAGNVVTLIDK